jgi:alpha-mannosidase
MQLETAADPECTIKETSPGVFELCNGQYEVVVSDGAITSLRDLETDRQLIPKGSKAGQLVLFDDKPLYWQAWDVEVYHLHSRTELTPNKVYISSTDPLCVSLTIETTISDKSKATTTISLRAEVGDQKTNSSIDFHTQVSWHETMKFLKVEFPVDIVNTSASYETQFGIVRRPTHYNTTWDMAKFEVCCHRWADLSESNYGVSILNDSKYGFAVAGNVMRLSLLRAPKAPDAHADMGDHTMRYAIFPHTGPVDERTVRKAAEFNSPVRIVDYVIPKEPGSKEQNLEADAFNGTPDLLSALSIRGADNLVLDTVKRAEDDADVSRGELPVNKGLNIIVRIYDALGGKSKGILSFGALNVETVHRVNVLEDEEEDLSKAMVERGVHIEVRAFEILTLKLGLREKEPYSVTGRVSPVSRAESQM